MFSWENSPADVNKDLFSALLKLRHVIEKL